jgi:ketosteroid isomerase-like protein
MADPTPVRQKIRFRDRPHRSLDERITVRFPAIKRGDLEFVLAAFYDPDVEWNGTVGGLDEGSLRRGHQEVLRGFDDYFAVWERLDLRPEEIIDTGDELIVFVHEVARGKESGIVVETDTATISTFREGMVVRVRGFMDRSQALEAAARGE